jgi:hypothetical protein
MGKRWKLIVLTRLFLVGTWDISQMVWIWSLSPPGTKVKYVKLHLHTCICLHCLVLETHNKVILLNLCALKTYRVCGCKDLHIFNLGTKWKWVISFTLATWSPGKEHTVLTLFKALWSHFVWIWRWRAELLTLPGFRPWLSNL